MTSRGDAPTITRRRSVLACARCRARRVKCDRAQPACSNCTKAGASCVPAQQSPSSSTPMSSRPGRRDTGDYNRLSKLEQEVARLSREVDSSSPSREVSITPSPDDAAEARHDTRGRILAGPNAQYFSPYSWAAVPDELANIDTLLGAARDVSVSNISTASSIGQDASLSLPDDRLHETLLGIFRQRVDPLVRLLHWPSFLEQCQIFRQRGGSRAEESSSTQYSPAFFSSSQFDGQQQALYPNAQIGSTQNPTGAKLPDSAFIGLLYSVYYAAVVAALHSPTPPDLGRNVNLFSLMATFKQEIARRLLAIDGSLSRDRSLQTLQAATLALTVEPETFDMHVKWLQLGAALRLAQSLGVHRDGAKYDLSPIEIEIRRRVWAQLCILDVQYAEQLGCEPTISADNHDSSLPLSIDDRDLSELEAQDAASRIGGETNFKTHHEVEIAQERQSPFSPMTLFIIEAEVSRLLAQLLSVDNRLREAARTARSVPGGQRGRSSSRGPPDIAYWASKLEHRFQTVYGIGGGDATNSMQYLVTEVAALSIAKAKFVTRMIDWKEKYSSMSGLGRDSEMLHLYQDAIRLSTRSISLIQHFSHSPFSWYTKRFRDIYTSSFLAIGLATEQPLNDEYLTLASSILGQLYPIDAATGDFLEQSLPKSAFGRLLLKARSSREFHLQTPGGAQTLRSQAMQAAAGADTSMFSSNMTAQVPSTFPTSTAGVSAFQSSGNLFEDFDAIMQDPLWTPDLGGTDNPYGPWSATTTSPAIPTHPPSRHSSQPSALPQQYHQRPVPIQNTYTTPVLASHSPATSNTSSLLAERMEQMPLPSFQIDPTSPIPGRGPARMNLGAHINETPISPGAAGINSAPSHTWPPLPQPEGELQVPGRVMRERSLSQPHHPYFLDVKSPRVARTKSMTIASSIQ